MSAAFTPTVTAIAAARESGRLALSDDLAAAGLAHLREVNENDLRDSATLARDPATEAFLAVCHARPSTTGRECAATSMTVWTITREPIGGAFAGVLDLVTATCEGGHTTRAKRVGVRSPAPTFGVCEDCAREARERANGAARASARAAELAARVTNRQLREEEALARRAIKTERLRLEREAQRAAANARLAQAAKARAEAHARRLQADKLARKLAKLPAEKLKAIVEAA